MIERGKERMMIEKNFTSKGKDLTKTKVMSFRSWKDEVNLWRLYAKAKDLTVDSMCSAALREYIDSHPLSIEEKMRYDKWAEILRF